MITTTRHIDRIGARSKVGAPKCSGVTMSNQALGQTAEVDHAHAAGDRVAQAHAHQHRDVDPETAHEAVDQEDGAEHQAGEEQEVQGAEVFRAFAAAGPVDRHREQAHADRGDHRAGHQRWEETHDARHEGGDEHAEETGGDGRAEDPGDAHAGHPGHRHHAADGGEAGAHHNRHADAHRADAQRLDQGGDAGDQQVGVDQEGDFFAREAGRLADDQRHGDGATVHQQHMLEAHQQQLRQRQALVYGRVGDAAISYHGHATPQAFLLLSVAGGHRKRQVPAAGYFWPNIHPRLQGDAVGCFISPLCARFNRFFVYKVIFCS